MRDATFAQARGMVAGLARLDGGHIDEQAALAQRGGGTLLEQYIAHHRAVFQQADGDVGLANGAGRLVVHRGAVRSQRFCLCARAVPCVNLVAGLAQALGHGKAHHANAQEGDACLRRWVHGVFRKTV